MPEGLVHIDKALTDVSIAYENAEFIGERLFPRIPVDFKSDKYYVYGKDRFNVRDDRIAPGDEARRTRWTLSSDNYFCEGHALKDYVPRQNENNSDPALDLQIDTAKVLTDQIGLNQEVNLVAALDAGMTSASLADQQSTPWNSNTYDPIAKIRAQQDVIAKRTGKRPNKLFLSRPVYTSVRQNSNTWAQAKAAGYITSSTGKAFAVTSAILADLLELEEVVVAEAIKNTANEGQAATLDFVWGARAVLAYVPKAIGRRTLALGGTFYWQKALKGIAGEGGVEGVGGDTGQFVKVYYWEPNTSDVVEVHKYYDLKLIAAECGVLFTNCNG